MKGRGLSVGIAVIICSAALSHGLAFAKDAPGGFDTDEDALGRPATIMMDAAPASPVPVSLDGQATEHAANGNPLWGIPVQSLHATRERPLFSPSRRPPMPPVVAAPVEPAKVVAPPPAEATLNLLGIVEGSGEGYAVFINNTTHDIVRLKTGEGEDGWILRSVSGREAVLEKNDRTRVLELPPITGAAK